MILNVLDVELLQGGYRHLNNLSFGGVEADRLGDVGAYSDLVRFDHGKEHPILLRYLNIPGFHFHRVLLNILQLFFPLSLILNLTLQVF